MYTNPDEARTDFVLAVGGLLAGRLAHQLVSDLPGYPQTGRLALLLFLAWMLLLTAVPAWWLARHRKAGLAAFGLSDDRAGLGQGLVLAIPVIGAGLVHGRAGGFAEALRGRISGASSPDPTIGGPDLTVLLTATVVIFLGSFALYAFLITRARAAFTRNEMSVTEALRTFGMGAAGVALVMGLLWSAFDQAGRPLTVGVNVVVLVVLILLADRMVPIAPTASRATFLAPAIVAVVVHIFFLGGFRANMTFSLYSGSLAAGMVIIMAALIEGRQRGRAALPLVAATAWYPSCLNPLWLDAIPGFAGC